MAPALVGSVGTAAQASVAGASVTPSFGTGESRTAGNLLVCWATDGAAAAQVPTTVTTGWSTIASSLLTACACCIMVKVAAGADAGPAVVGSGKAWAQVAEFSGTTATADRSGSGSGTASTITATNAAADAASGELALACWALRLSSAATLTASPTTTVTSNNTTFTISQDNATSVQNHYQNCYGVTTANASATNAVAAWAGGTTTDATICLVTLQLPAAGGTDIPEIVMAPAVLR